MCATITVPFIGAEVNADEFVICISNTEEQQDGTAYNYSILVSCFRGMRVLCDFCEYSLYNHENCLFHRIL
jgi:hypothetical protein